MEVDVDRSVEQMGQGALRHFGVELTEAHDIVVDRAPRRSRVVSRVSIHRGRQ
jgi:hypothetical protein